MIAKPVALLIGVFILAFVAVSLVADLLLPGGFNVGQTIAGLYEKKECECEYNAEYEDYMCNSYCGDMSNAFCSSTTYCLD